MRRPATDVFTWCDTPSVEACARCAVPKASLTKIVAPVSTTRRAAKAGSFASSSLWNRTFSSISTPPGARAAAMRFTSGPTQSGAMATGRPRSCDRRSAAGFRLSAGSGPFFGRPRCDASTTRARPSIRRRRVGTAAVIRVSSVMRPSSRGTLKSTRAKTVAPDRFVRSATVFFATGVGALGGEGSVAIGHQVHEVLHAVAEAPLVVVPAEYLQEVPAHDLGEGRVHDGRGRVAAVVDGDQLLVRHHQHALHPSPRRLAEGGVDVLGAGGLLELDGEVDDGDVGGRHADGH